MGAVNTRALHDNGGRRRHGRAFWICLAAVLGGSLLPGIAAAQSLNGSLRMDYQASESNLAADGRVERLNQQYFIRAIDRLFVKNTVIFTGNFAYRTGGDGQPVDFHPHYEWLLSGYGYGARVAYEPFTQRRGAVASEEMVRRWRSGLYVNPYRWPRLTYDFTRTKSDRHSEGVSRDNWNSYAISWQPGTTSWAGVYSRQVRSTRDTLADVLETYRASASSDHALPFRSHLGLAYNYDRSWRQRLGAEAGALDQHTPSINVSAQPASWLGWSSQYTGRFRIRHDPQLARPERTQDQTATGSIALAPLEGFSIAALRYYDKSREASDQGGQVSDYWQVRASQEGRFFRQVRGLFTAYRIVYVGRPEGKKYSDALFASLRGRVHAHAELSTEASLTDQHGASSERYVANANVYARLSPTQNSQVQTGYSIQALAHERGNFDINNETVLANMQWYPDPNISLSLGTTLGRNRLLSSAWTSSWTGAASYRWPAFANISLNYNRRDRRKLVGASAAGDQAATETLLLDAVWWVEHATTVTVGWSHRGGGTGIAGDQWSVGLATQF